MTAQGYKVLENWQIRKGRVRVDFSHVGQTTFTAMAEHEKYLPKLVGKHGGFYDGWESIVAHVQSDEEQLERDYGARFPLRHPSAEMQMPMQKKSLIF